MTIRIIRGDCRELLRTLEPESVHCVVTSPPYFGLRDYGTARWEGGCDHIERTAETIATSNGLGPNGYLPSSNAAFQGRAKQFRDVCGKCGARRIDSQIGLEPTPDEYITELVVVFREARRVLRKDGTLWLNLGDSYATQGGRGEARMVELGKPSAGALTPAAARGAASGIKMPAGWKAKDLLMIPARVALALQADGWWLRSDIIWAKSNPMPESVQDRPTSAHEHIFLLAKSERYFFDADAVREAAISDHPSGNGYKRDARLTYQNSFGEGRGNPMQWEIGEYRNIRNVWTIATSPFAEAHFATFPPELAERCIKAGCPIGGVVLDPFGGAGTTGLVSDRLQRNAILIELNPEYAAMAERRIQGDAPLFAEVGQ